MSADTRSMADAKADAKKHLGHAIDALQDADEDIEMIDTVERIYADL